MKRYILTTAVIAMFALYSFELRHNPDFHIAIASAPTNQKTSASTGSSGSGNIPIDNSSTTSTPAATVPKSQYRDGTYTGATADAYYGDVQIKVTIVSGQISKVVFLQYPTDHRTSVEINQQAMPLLQREAIQAQSSKVSLITGATFTSRAFIESLSSALKQAS